MRPRVPLVAACLSVAAGAGVVTQSGAQPPVFRTSVDTVTVWATVQDGTGRLVPDLTRDDFEVSVGGRRQEIAVFSSEEQPITVVLLLDMSGSVTNRLLRIREASRHFVRALKPVDRARIGTFGEEISISPILTNDHGVLERILSEELWPGSSTPLWGALGAAVDSLQTEDGRRVVLVLTDGYPSGALDGYPAHYGSVRNGIRDLGVLLYAIGVRGISVGVRGSVFGGEMAGLVDDSGGGRFDLLDDADLESTFTRVAEELRRQYLIGFVPDDRLRGRQRLDVRVKAKGHRVRTRREVTIGAAR